jgi:hypothetical protein
MSYNEVAEQSAIYALRIMELEKALREAEKALSNARPSGIGPGCYALHVARSALAKA